MNLFKTGIEKISCICRNVSMFQYFTFQKYKILIIKTVLYFIILFINCYFVIFSFIY